MNHCEVTTKYGSLRGERRKGVSTFRGIPYAKPPVGELRFAPPWSARPSRPSPRLIWTFPWGR